MKQIILIIALTLFSIFACLSQSSNTLETVFRDWGKDVAGVRLSIGLTNNIVPVGSTFPAFVEMKNSSTNIIHMGESSPEQDFKIFLTSAAGKTYQLTRTPMGFTKLMLAKLDPGASRSWIINVGVNHYFDPPGYIPTDTNFPPGNYVIKATRTFVIGNKGFGLASNNLNIQIK